MSKKALYLALAAAIAAVVAVAAFSMLRERALEPRARRAASALSMIPPGPALVLTLDVANLRKGPAGALLGRRLVALSNLSKRCGFEPLEEVEQLALAMPSAATGTSAGLSTGELGLIATGDFSAARVLQCAELSIRERKGEPGRTRIGPFSTVRDKSKSGGELAVRDGGPLIVSGGSYFRELLDAAEASQPAAPQAAARDAIHVELRRALGASAPLLLSWVLPPKWTETFVSQREAQLSRLSGVRALAVKATFDAGVALEGLVACADEQACRDLSGFIEEFRGALGPELTVGDSWRLATRVRIEQDRAKLRLRLTLDRAELESLLDLAVEPKPENQSTP